MTLLPEGSVWLYGNVCRPMLGREKLAIQGIGFKSWPKLDNMSEGDTRFPFVWFFSCRVDH